MSTDAELIYQFLSETDPPPAHADLILALGTHDLRVADYAAEVLLSGRAPLLVCSGGLGKITTDCFTRPEAELFADRCRQRGVPADQLILETASTNTGENFTCSRALLAKMGIYPKTGIAVCKPYMAKRALATGAKQWPEVSWGVMTEPLTLAEYGCDRTTVNLMVGDLQRLRVYADIGYQAPTEVPETIWAAFERLVAKGYNQFVIS